MGSTSTGARRSPGQGNASRRSGGSAPPSGLSDEERQRYEKMKGWFAKEVAYALQMGLRPQTLYGIVDSPVGLAASAAESASLAWLRNTATSPRSFINSRN